MATLPAELIPDVSAGYGFGATSNLIPPAVSGLIPTGIRDLKYGVTPFNITITCSDPDNVNIFQSFFYHDIDKGARPFTMNLDSSGTIEQHVVMIQQGTINIVGDDPWIISFTALADRLPIQDGP